MNVIQVSTDFRVITGDIFQARSLTCSAARKFSDLLEEAIVINQGDGFLATFIVKAVDKAKALQIVQEIQELATRSMLGGSEPIKGNWHESRVEIYEKPAV